MPESKPFVDFAGRWIVVAGASSGIGRAISVELAQWGARIVLIGRDEARLAETAAQLGDAAHHVLALDLSKHELIVPEIQRVRNEIGPIYGMCYSAGIVETRPLAATTVDIVRSQLDVNVIAAIELARAVARRDVMMPDGGSLLFVSSVYGHVGMPGQIGYCGTKGALGAIARAMAIELARRNVRVNCISPGLVFTNMTDRALGKLSSDHVERLKAAHPLGAGQPEDVARAAAFMLAPGSRWITGADLVVDGGFTAQ
jgi:NAD(P)-dependent dehydrogenase (short-subunit alcohol dehydrogenase family)